MNILTEAVLIKRWILILKSVIASLTSTMSVFEQGKANKEQRELQNSVIINHRGSQSFAEDDLSQKLIEFQSLVYGYPKENEFSVFICEICGELKLRENQCHGVVIYHSPVLSMYEFLVGSFEPEQVSDGSQCQRGYLHQCLQQSAVEQTGGDRNEHGCHLRCGQYPPFGCRLPAHQCSEQCQPENGRQLHQARGEHPLDNFIGQIRFRPPSPPSGPPLATYFSRRKLT